MANVFVFGLMGTLLDLSALDPLFEREFGAGWIRREWFEEAPKTAFAITAAGGFGPFADATESALKVIESRYGASRSWSRLMRKRILYALRRVPAFPDVCPAVENLRRST